MSKKLVIVSGMHRSGTSGLARSIVELGFDPGLNLMPGNSGNPHGYYEDLDIFRLNESILSNLFVTWDKVEDFDNRKIHLFQDEIYKQFSEAAIKLIKEKFERHDKVIIKDPRFCILMPFWKNVFEAVDAEIFKFHIFRNPLSVAKSLENRNGIPMKNGLLLWYYYNISALAYPDASTLYISYHKLVSEPEKVFNIINETLGSDNPDFSHEKPGAFLGSIDQNLNHNKSTDAELKAQSSFLPEIFKLWNFLNLATQNHDHENIQNLPAEYLKPKLSSLVGEDLTNRLNLSFFRRGKNEKIISQTIQIHQKDSKLKVEFKFSDKENEVQDFSLFLCDKPCMVSIKPLNLFSGSEQIRANPIGGNFAQFDGNRYYFDNNSPFLNYALKESKKLDSVEAEIEIELINHENAALLIPALKLKYQAKLQQIEDQSEQIAFLKHKISDHISENQVLKQGNVKLNAEVSAFKDELQILGRKNQDFQKLILQQKKELDALEKKSRWLYDEYNRTKASLSWKITYPLRLFQKAIQRIGYIIYVLVNDVQVGFWILKRDGVSGFLYRLSWYVRGKRLKEDIAMSQKFAGGRDFYIKTAEPLTTIIFPTTTNPLVSIIIPAYNNFFYTYRCIQSIKENTQEVDFEIILIDDHSGDETTTCEQLFQGINIIHNPVNLGFLRSCNKAAKQAKGKYLHFLNNDTQVSAGWLNSLVDLAESSDQIGLIGSKLVYPDGRLQEAGGIIWDDATGWNYGKFDNPEKSEYNYVKEVDYVSGASMLVRKDIWQKLGGFDERFNPAYYEDTDLAFGVRKSGYKVMYQPLSMVTHFEGLTNGKSEKKGIKKHQALNQDKFITKWDHELRIGASPNGKNVFFHRDRSLRKKHILVIDHYVPHFDQDAGSRSTFNYMKLFVKMGFQVHFIGDNFYRHQPYTQILEELGIEVLYGDYYQINVRNWIRENGNYFDFIITHRIHIAPKYLDILKKYSNAKIAYIGHDLQFISSLRKFKFTGDNKHKADSRKFKKIETKIFKTVDIIFPFSTYEAPFIKEIAPEKIVKTLPVYFYDNIPKNTTGFDSRKDILYVGFFGHPPNIDAAIWFCNEIFPLIQQKIPGVKLNIVGSNPTYEIKNLENDSVNVSGYVSDDKLLEYYQHSKVAVLPLRFGAGVKGKLLESLFHQIPTVITSVAAEGVPEIESYSLIADTADDFSKKIVKLYTHQIIWEKYSTGGKELIEKYYTEGSARKIMESAFGIDDKQNSKLI